MSKFLEKIQSGEFTGLSRAFGGGKHSENNGGITSTSSGGVMGGPQRKKAPGSKFWDDEDGSGALNISLRVLQTFLPFVNLCIYIAIAAFQKKWGVGPSFLTGLSIFFNIESLLHAAIFLATPLLYDNVKMLRSVSRGLRQIRTAFIINTFQMSFMLLIALVTTISAYGGGCKNPADDPNSDLKGYTDAMGPFCRNKRAGAAFFWFNFLAWLTTALFVLLKWQSIRKNPTTTGFTIPGAQFPQDDEEAFAHHTDTEIADDPDRVYRPSGDYYATEGERGLFGETSQGYGGNDGEEESYHNTPAVDPFADQGRREFEGNYEDSYDTIRKSMDVTRPTYQ